MNSRSGWLPSTSPGAVAVMSTLVTEGAMSRADLSRRTGLTSAAVTKVVTPLADAGYLQEVGRSVSGSLGRPASLVEVCGEAAYFVGVKVTDVEILGVLVDLSGQIRATQSRKLASRDVDEVVESIGALTESLRESADHPDRLRYVAIGISGDVDRESGLVSYSPFLRWHGVRLAQQVQAKVGLPTLVENDVRALTAGEHWFGAGVGKPSFAVVTVGAGIGCAMSVRGQVLAGVHGVSGELGHLPIAGDRACYCGAVGCLETVAGTAAILRDVSTAVGSEVTDLAAAVAWGEQDPRAAAVFHEVGRVLGLGIASVVNLFGPQSVVLTGEGLVALDLVREPMRAAFVVQAYGQAIHSELIVRPLTFEAWARGAATMALQAFIRGAV
ncbi:ROK family transcriptional regulator [Nocardioides sp.]|uniref:ROK family transcriptional regulator n=1 Tax=Nocardioides sp. TaxID=35761 RepID=UPI0031FE5E44